MNLEDRITIIHGPNGFGKTVLLRMLDGLFGSRYVEFHNIPFTEFKIEFDDKSEFWVHTNSEAHEKKARKRSGGPILIFNFARPEANSKSFSPFQVDSQKDFPLSIIEHEIPELERIWTTKWKWHHLPTGEVLSLEEVLDRYGHILPFKNLSKLSDEQEWMQELRNSIHVRFIQTQRLLSSSSVPVKSPYEKPAAMVPAVNRYSDDLADLMQSTLAEYAALSQSLDRSFPQRLVVQKPASVLAVDELTNKLRELEQRRSSLMEIGLLDKEEKAAFQMPRQIDETQISVLSVYVQDVEKKFSVFDEIAAKIKLFSEIINGRFLYKKMTISKEKGFTFATSKGDPLSPSSLSSGEQHELVLLYELLFKIKRNSLILIDEPELSLHVAWQEQFLKDLQKITRLSDFDVLISTHSPQIISDRWDLTVELRRPAE
jgi:predicted ATP-binding protein involved in virulence